MPTLDDRLAEAYATASTSHNIRGHLPVRVSRTFLVSPANEHSPQTHSSPPKIRPVRGTACYSIFISAQFQQGKWSLTGLLHCQFAFLTFAFIRGSLLLNFILNQSGPQQLNVHRTFRYIPSPCWGSKSYLSCSTRRRSFLLHRSILRSSRIPSCCSGNRNYSLIALTIVWPQQAIYSRWRWRYVSRFWKGDMAT